MSTGNTLMVRDIFGRSYMTDNGGLDPNLWWLIVFIIGFVIFEIIK